MINVSPVFPQCFPSVSPVTREVNFTVPWLDRLKAPQKREDYRDRSTRGLQLRVSSTGVKSFSYAFRFGNKMGRVTLGKYPDLDLKTARQKTDEFRRMVSMGLDPRSEKREKITKQNMTVELYYSFPGSHRAISGNATRSTVPTHNRIKNGITERIVRPRSSEVKPCKM